MLYERKKEDPKKNKQIFKLNKKKKDLFIVGG